MTQNPQYATLIKLHKIINLISAKFAENITVAKKGDKKSYTKSMILFFLLLDGDGNYTQAKLVKYCNASKQFVSVVINQLEKDGYITITKHIIKLTQRGIGYANKILGRVISGEIGALPINSTNTIFNQNYTELLDLKDLEKFCKKCTGLDIK